MRTTVDVLVVGAGPTGLALAAQLHRHGASVHVIDAADAPVRESRAFGVQPRSLEILRSLGVADQLIEKGSAGAHLAVHGRRRTVHLPLFDDDVRDTAYPYVLFVPQSETEAALASYLVGRDITVHRGTRYVGHQATTDGVVTRVIGPDGSREIASRFLVGCDGAHSSVRRSLGIDFTGHRHPQRFLLADLELRGDLDRRCVHAWFGREGLLFLFPLAAPASWRLVTTLADHDPVVDAVPRVLDRHLDGRLQPGPTAWVSEFRVSARQARRYRAGSVFLAGDAAHVHSPAGGQGMNTGLLDAWNLGWKLAMVAQGRAQETLLDTYEGERWPIGRGVVELTERLLRAATSPRWAPVRAQVAPSLVWVVGHLPQRSAAFRRMAQLAHHYRSSPLSTQDIWQGGLRAGDRLPDLPVSVLGSPVLSHPGQMPMERPRTSLGLHELTQAPGFHVVVCGGRLLGASARTGPGVTTHVVDGWHPGWRVVVVRPDGHIGYLGGSLEGAHGYLSRWLRTPRLELAENVEVVP